MKTSYKINIRIPLTILTIVFFIMGCKKGSEDVVENLSGDAYLSIKVEGIKEVVEDPATMLATGRTDELKANSKRTTVGKKNLLRKSFPGFDADIQLKNETLENKVVSSSKKSSSSSNFKAAALPNIPMAQGTKYKILLYKAGGYVKTVSAVAGTLIKVEVEKNVEYNWYAYTYNTADDLPEVANTANPVIESLTDKALYYASGTVMVTGEGVVNKPLNLEFDHRTSRVGIEISARGMFAGIQTIQATLASNTYVKKGVLNLLTGQYESINTVDVGPLTFSSISAATKDTIKVAYYYTAGQEAITPFVVNVQSITLKLDKGDTRTFSTGFQYSNNLSTMTWGNRMTSAIDLVESPLTVAGVEWARANLYFSSADKAYRFRHQISSSYGRVDEEYWNFKAPFPNGTIGAQDPCTRVYPLNTWRMPSRSETEALIDVTAGRTLDPDYVEYAATGTGAPYPSNRLRINKMGYFNVVLGIFGVNEDGDNGYFWTSETGIFGGLVTGVYCYRVSDDKKNGILGGDNVWLHTALSSWGGSENIRCVRNK